MRPIMNGMKISGMSSRRREFCHSADALSPSRLKYLTKVEGGWCSRVTQPFAAGAGLSVAVVFIAHLVGCLWYYAGSIDQVTGRQCADPLKMPLSSGRVERPFAVASR